MKHWLLVTAFAVAVVPSGFVQAAGKLTGHVTSADEGAMEGVVVSAKKDGSTIAISVISDDKGNFSFSATTLEPGKYALRIRAVGYELDGPKTVDVTDDGAPIAVKLKKTGNLSAQLTSGEWMASFPGTAQQKNIREPCN